MDAVILAAGKGTRLQPITNDTPKPLVKIEGKPIIEYGVSALAAQGIKKVFVVVQYKKEMIIQFLDAIKEKYGMQIEYVHQEQMLGTAHAVSLIPATISDPFVVLVGDTVFEKLLHCLPNQHYLWKKQTTQ